MNLEKKIILDSYLTDFVSLALILFYSLFSARIPLSEVILILRFVIPVQLSFILLAGPVTSHLACRSASRGMEEADKGRGDDKSRTELLAELNRLPKVALFSTAAYFLAGFLTAFSFVKGVFHLSFPTLFTILIEWICGSYFAGLISYSFRHKRCEACAKKITRAGINQRLVTVRRHFGFSLRTQIRFYIFIPLVLTTLVTLTLYFFTLPENQKAFSSMMREMATSEGIGLISQNPVSPPPLSERLREASSLPAGARAFSGMRGLWGWRIKCTALFNAAIMCIQILIFYLNFMSKNGKSIRGLEGLRDSHFREASALTSDLGDELSYNIYMINSLIQKFQSMISNSLATARMITESSAALIKISDETEKNADSQSSKTSDIISGMEENKRLSMQIDSLAGEVAESAQATSSDMDSSAQIMQKTLSNMQAIGSSNESTLSSIKELEQKVASIWEIVNLINSIAEQTKIIAFNTELESAGTSDEEKSFLNVALETRRLANSIADATREIKDYIRQMEATEEQLQEHSASNTDEINRGLELSRSIERSFYGVNELSTQNAAATQEIKDLIKNQTVSFEQIQETLIQIGAGIRNFTLSASSLVNASGELNASAQKLSMEGRQ